jgi:hypothetical protein
MPREGDVFLLGVVWWNSTKKNLQGMECQNLLSYTSSSNVSPPGPALQISSPGVRKLCVRKREFRSLAS